MGTLTVFEDKKHAPQTDNSFTVLTVNASALMKMLNCGRPTAARLGTAAGAKIIIGRKTPWNLRRWQNTRITSANDASSMKGGDKTNIYSNPTEPVC